MSEPVYRAVTPYLAVKDSAAAIDFYQRAFGAVEILRLPDDQGRISHAEIRLGSLPVMISDEYPEIDVFGPQSLGGSAVMIILEVADVDALFARAVAAGAVVVRPLLDGFNGALRTAKVDDPFGHRWMLLTKRE
jgi:PhnB protein